MAQLSHPRIMSLSQKFKFFYVLKIIFIFMYLFFKLINYLFFGSVGSSLLLAGFLWLQQAGATLCCGALVSHCGGFSCCEAQALGSRASVVVVHGLSSCGSRALVCRLSSCGTWAQLLCGMWDLPRSGLEPVSPALAGRFLTTVPPGKSIKIIFRVSIKINT